MATELFTPDELVYKFSPNTTGSLHFKVRAANDAHIALTGGPEESDPMYEIFIGGWSNSKSVVRRNRTKPDVAEVETPGILSDGEFRGFWITWDNGSVAAGKEGEATPFLTYTDPEPFGIGYYGVCTGWGASGSWIVEEDGAEEELQNGEKKEDDEEQQGDEPAEGDPAVTQPGWNVPAAGAGGVGTWVDAAGGEVPSDAVPGGFDGEQLYVARARHEGALIPGKLVPSHGVVYVPWGGAEHGKSEYQVLTGVSPNWVAAKDGDVPTGAISAGETEDGEPVYVGRVETNGAHSIGKVQKSHGACYIPYGGLESSFPDYEVLVSN